MAYLSLVLGVLSFPFKWLWSVMNAAVLVISPNPPMDRDGWREDSGRG